MDKEVHKKVKRVAQKDESGLRVKKEVKEEQSEKALKADKDLKEPQKVPQRAQKAKAEPKDELPEDVKQQGEVKAKRGRNAGEAPRERKERKVYDLPGQKHDPPEERDGLRIFYESLYSQRPDSEMAQIWMMEHGLLERSEAEAVLQVVKLRKSGSTNGGISIKLKRNGQAETTNVRTAPAAKPPPSRKTKEDTRKVEKPTRPVPTAKPKRRLEEYSEDDEEVMPVRKIRSGR